MRPVAGSAGSRSAGSRSVGGRSVGGRSVGGREEHGLFMMGCRCGRMVMGVFTPLFVEARPGKLVALGMGLVFLPPTADVSEKHVKVYHR